MEFTLASFNVKNLIGPDQEYYKFQSYTPEEHAWKVDWMADQLLSMDADIVGFQEIFEEDALKHVIEETNERGAALNAAVIPSRDKRYHRKAIFKKLGFDAYDTKHLAFARNINDVDEPGKRRPGVAVLSRFGFHGAPEVIQELPEPLGIPMQDLTGGDGGTIKVTRLSRPILKVRIPVGNQIVTFFTCHLKSKLGEFPRPEHGGPAPEVDLTQYDPIGRALGAMRAAVRRMAEAWVLRCEIVKELEAGNPVVVTGDFNDGEHAVSSEIISGETPFKNYAWMLRHDAETPRDRYSEAEDQAIRAAMLQMQLVSAENLFLRKSLRDVVYTTAFGGVHESIDQIYLSRHFNPDNPDRIGDMEYFSVFNDHLTDGSHPEAPYNKLASDHGQIMAHMRLK
jgi:hypothetical protein